MNDTGQSLSESTEVRRTDEMSPVLGLVAVYLAVGVAVAIVRLEPSAMFGPSDFLLFLRDMIVWPLVLIL